MQKKLVFKPNIDINVYSNIDLQVLREPLQVTREEMEEVNAFENRKSKSIVIDYEDEDYKMLREKESMPLIITDNNGKQYNGKLQTIIGDSAFYLAFFEKENEIIVVMVNKWYFWTRRNSVFESENAIEMINEKTKELKDEKSEESDNEGIDYEENFDDDDNENDVVDVIKKKKILDDSGERLQNLVAELTDKPYEKEDNIRNKTENNEDVEKRMKKTLCLDDLRKIMSKKKITIKELIANIKNNFPIGNEQKILIREFIKNNCKSEQNKKTGEFLFSLK